VQLADRVIVMSRRPGDRSRKSCRESPAARDLDSPEYLALRDRIFVSMGREREGRVAEQSSPSGSA
jgi:ABC-type nitrate/sulfonate/bicarbonate transport system ATPase subunit